MFKKEYTLGPLTYGYMREYRKWRFQAGTVCILVACKGNIQGHKVANIIAGSIKRCGSIDNMARANINKVCQ